ncbi:MAG: hypothetical protein V4622_08795 [Bacteroidota bacterium]
MIYNFQSQVINSNPVELAQKRLESHKQKGMNSSLSIFEVANLMDTILFTNNQSQSQSNFQVCFN